MSKNSDGPASATDRAVQTVPENPDPDLSPKAIAARIGDRNLWIGNVGAIKPRLLAAMELDPEYVVSVNRTATKATTDHCPLKDGQVNDQQQFTNAVTATRNHIRHEGTVLVNCSVGVSRSATVIATAIAAEDELSFNAAVAEIRERRPRARPHPRLQLNAYAYLVTVENRVDARKQLAELVDSTHIRSQNVKAIEELI
jgi:atypical dual specificity phosphatase